MANEIGTEKVKVNKAYAVESIRDHWIRTEDMLPMKDEVVLAFYPIATCLQDSFNLQSYKIRMFLMSEMWIDENGETFAPPPYWISLDRPIEFGKSPNPGR